jgi:hypothetical protein
MENQEEVEDVSGCDAAAAGWGCDVGLGGLLSGADPVSAWMRERNFAISGSMLLLEGCAAGASWGCAEVEAEADAESAGAGVLGGDGVAQSQPMMVMIREDEEDSCDSEVEMASRGVAVFVEERGESAAVGLGVDNVCLGWRSSTGRRLDCFHLARASLDGPALAAAAGGTRGAGPARIACPSVPIPACGPTSTKSPPALDTPRSPTTRTWPR